MFSPKFIFVQILLWRWIVYSSTIVARTPYSFNDQHNQVPNGSLVEGVPHFLRGSYEAHDERNVWSFDTSFGVTQNTIEALCSFIYSTSITSIDNNWKCSNSTIFSNPCTWNGITCNSNNEITHLSFVDYAINGNIPNEINKLSNLIVLDLTGNNLNGTIPSAIGDLIHLSNISFAYNNFTGNIPITIGKLTCLQYLSISYNSITGIIPTLIVNISNLQYLYMNSNSLQGSIPNNIGQFKNLYEIYLNNNQITNSIPITIGHLSSNIHIINLQNNFINSSIPASISQLTTIQQLIFDNNQITGILPTQMNKLINLEKLQFSNNNFGQQSIPNFISKLSNLLVLDLSSNKFTSSISSTIIFPEKLQIINFSYNKLIGSIPNNIFKLNDLSMLSLNNNNLTGSIPINIGKLIHLQILKLEYNNFIGTIPKQLSLCSYLKHLSIQYNTNITKNIPSELCKTRLTSLYIKNTAISCIPSCLIIRHNDYDNNDILHCFSKQDFSICSLAYLMNKESINNKFSHTLDAVTFQSAHPRYRLQINGLASIKYISISSAFKYEIIFDALTDITCPISFCSDEKCSDDNIYRTISNYKDLPGVGNNKNLVISASSFYVSIGSLTCNNNNNNNNNRGIANSEWGYSFNVIGTENTVGWKCDEVPTSTIVDVEPSSMHPSYSTDACKWTGVTCEGGSKVTEINLSAYGISGSIPLEISFLDGLKSLDLSYNSLTSTIPSELYRMSKLQSLKLIGNILTGTVPITFGLFSALTLLSLESNKLQGNFPYIVTNISSLEILSLKSNKFTGKLLNEYSFMFQNPRNVTLDIQNNPGITCYESKWINLKTLTTDPTVGVCAPSSVPTSTPTGLLFSTSSSSSSSTEVLNTDSIIGIVIAGFMFLIILLLLLLYSTRYKKISPENKVKIDSLNTHPLHKAIYDGNITIDRKLVIDNLKTAKEKDFDNKTVIDLILEKRIKCDQISSDLLYILIEDSLPFDKITGISINDPTQHNYAWSKLIQNDDDRSIQVVEMILANYKSFINILAYSKHEKGRSCIEIASEKCQCLMNRILFLHQKYELDPTVHHKNSTGEVWFAKLHLNYVYNNNNSTAIATPPSTSLSLTTATNTNTSLKTSSETTEVETCIRVALKFMKYRDQFRNEVIIRQEGKFDEKYIVGILEAYDGDNITTSTTTNTNTNDINTINNNKEFREDAILKGFQEFPYCIVMKAAELNLISTLRQHDIAGQDRDEIRRIIKHVLLATDHLHSKGYVHGDVKPANIVCTANSYKLIDFDGSANFKLNQCVGSSFSTLYTPPELLYMDNTSNSSNNNDNINAKFNGSGSGKGGGAGGGVKVREFIRDPETRIPIGKYPYDLVLAAPSHDMWSIGVLLYYLATGSQMFAADNLDHIVDPDDLKQLMLWDINIKKKKISTILHRPIQSKENMTVLIRLQNLLSLLLYKDPSKRPSCKVALDHPFVSGKAPSRMQGEKPSYDVFLSYRVDSDSIHVEMLYSALIKIGLKVWWDRASLEPGKKWEEGFCDGLVNSAYFVCLLSRGAINNSEKTWQNFSKLEQFSNCDNVLLEWRLALELKDRGMIGGIYPIFIGDYNESDHHYTHYFKNNCHCKELIDNPVDAVEMKLIEHLDRQALGQPYRHNGQITVKAIVNEIISNQGGFIEGEIGTAMHTIANRISVMVSPDLKEVHDASFMKTILVNYPPSPIRP